MTPQEKRAAAAWLRDDEQNGIYPQHIHCRCYDNAAEALTISAERDEAVAEPSGQARYEEAISLDLQAVRHALETGQRSAAKTKARAALERLEGRGLFGPVSK